MPLSFEGPVPNRMYGQESFANISAVVHHEHSVTNVSPLLLHLS